jgi:hypothetical protein
MDLMVVVLSVLKVLYSMNFGVYYRMRESIESLATREVG